MRQQVPAIMCLLLVLFYSYYWEENVDVVKFHVGVIASAVTIAFFAAPLTKLVGFN